jgi:hypothetical protein
VVLTYYIIEQTARGRTGPTSIIAIHSHLALRMMLSHRTEMEVSQTLVWNWLLARRRSKARRERSDRQVIIVAIMGLWMGGKLSYRSRLSTMSTC